jgi:pyridoxamine 5'-phosphate oxidase
MSLFSHELPNHLIQPFAIHPFYTQFKLLHRKNMKKSIADIRTDYTKKSLDLHESKEDALEQFHQWFTEALEAEVIEPNAMNLATASSMGRPSSRIVLLKGLDEGCFIFYTNYSSKKGRELAVNPYASLTFFWPELERQVRIEGKVEKVEAQTSEEYFNSRPRASQIGAWASQQSREVENREELEKRFAELEKEFEGKDIPRPKHWGGYKLRPYSIEFWQGRPSRLHDRIKYSRPENSDGPWKIERLSP